MLAHREIFCNTPWYEFHIYWDGSFGICCQESHKLYTESDQQYNISKMTIAEWFNSPPARNFRERMLGEQKLSECASCYADESQCGHSRRLKGNQKSVIFTRTAFDDSFRQSPGFPAFDYSNTTQGQTITHPVDIHIDLGNYCNLACKMCNAQASSTIAVQEVKWGIESSKPYVGLNWTKNQEVWDNFKQQLLDIPKLNNIHLMGGETLLTDRFEDLVDTMIEHRRFDICFSFVSNGTIFKSSLIDKLKKFKRVGIEISIETLDLRNSYVRQGTDNAVVMTNIKQYVEYCNGSSITLCLRPAPSLLSIGSYAELLKFALKQQLVVKANFCYKPRFMSIEILPTSVKNAYMIEYQKFADSLTVDISGDYNASDPNNCAAILKEQALMCVNVLKTPTPRDSEIQLQQLVEHCQKWDKVYNLNARDLYPELNEIWDRYDY